MKEVYEAGSRFLEQGETIVVITVIEKQGSAPRSVGAKMIVSQGKSTFGTIGGGKVEEDMVAAAYTMFESRQSELKSADMTHEDLVPGHMVCGGQMDFLLEYLPPEDSHRSFFKAVLQKFDNRESGLICSAWQDQGDQPKVHRGIFAGDRLVQGEFLLGDVSLESIKKRATGQKRAELVSVEGGACWLEPILDQSTLFLFGAGHVAMPVAEIANLVGFRVVALDDRAEYANVDRYPPPMSAKAIPDFEGCMSQLEIDEESYIVIVTRAHTHDKTVLAQALKTKAGYIGMIGSRKKRGVIYRALKEEGFTDTDLDRVHSPIGLDIKAETPEEIGVSIVGELIRVKAEKSRNK